MNQENTSGQENINPRRSINDKTVKNLADNIFEKLSQEGCQPRDIICISSQLLGLVAHKLQQGRPVTRQP